LSLSFQLSLTPTALHSFPTRRSSDLLGHQIQPVALRRFVGRLGHADVEGHLGPRLHGAAAAAGLTSASGRRRHAAAPARFARLRSEELTSELQSLTNLVCRLLLAKKN